MALIGILLTLYLSKWIFWLYVDEPKLALRYFIGFLLLEVIGIAVSIVGGKLSGAGTGEAFLACLIRTAIACFIGFVFWTAYYFIFV